MKHAAICAVGLFWGVIALGVLGMMAWMSGSHSVSRILLEEIIPKAPKFVVPAVVSSYLVTAVFSKALFSGNIQRKFWLPFLTIPIGVICWGLLIAAASLINTWTAGRNHDFNALIFFTYTATFIAMTFALPVTYPAAYATQVFLARTVGPGYQ